MDSESAKPEVPTESINSSEQTPSPLVAAFQREHPNWIVEVVEALGETTIVVAREHIAAVCGFLKT